MPPCPTRSRCLAGLLTLAVVAMASMRADASPFVNLNFEQSTVPMNAPQVVSTAAAFPGWTAEINGSPINTVYHDYPGAGEPVVAIYDKENTQSAMLLLEGAYMAYLGTGTNGQRGSLSQTGDIPGGIKALTLLGDGFAGPPVFTVNGTVIPMSHLGGIPTTHERNLYGADIAAYAGTTVTMRFASSTFFELPSGRRALDDIQFSTSPLPEPASGVAVLAGVAGAVGRGRRRPSRRRRRE